MTKPKKTSKGKVVLPKNNWIEWTFSQLAMKKEDQEADYNRREVDKTWVNGIGVSTVWTDYFGVYETALLDDNGTHPVERHETKEDAIKGHKKWVKFAEKGEGKKVTKLGDGEIVEDEDILLVKKTWLTQNTPQ